MAFSLEKLMLTIVSIIVATAVARAEPSAPTIERGSFAALADDDDCGPTSNGDAERTQPCALALRARHLRATSREEARANASKSTNLAPAAADLYSRPPCGNVNGYGQILYTERAIGSICVPTCPMVGVYREFCPRAPGGLSTRCTAVEDEDLCMVRCKDGKECPTGMVCGEQGVCLYPSTTVDCVFDSLIGTWKVNDAFGIKGVEVKLTIEHTAPGDADCPDPHAKIEYLGTKLNYQITATQSIPGQLYVKYYNKEGQAPTVGTPYYHEGYHLGTDDVLLEDLNFKNGEKSPDTTGVLLYHRV